jgi:hypothetical protein
MTAPLRGTQSLVGQMGWVFNRPLLIAIEVGWRWLFGIPFLAVCWMQEQRILAEVPPSSAGLDAINTQNPWQASVQLAHAWTLYAPHVGEVLRWLGPIGAVAWVVVSAMGRSFVLKRIDPELAARLRFRPLRMMLLQTGWLLLLGATWWGWFRSMEWVAAARISTGSEPDLVGFAIWLIFLSLGFFTVWALVSWTFSVAPILMLLEDRSAFSALGQSPRLGKEFTGKLVEINMVMGIVNLALIVLAMVLSAAPLPFSDELGADALHGISAVAIVFYFVASDYFQVVRLKGFQEFWKMFRVNEVGESESRQAGKSAGY